MKLRKLLASVSALAIAMSTLMAVPVAADTIDSETVYVPDKVLKVTLPTTNSQKFYLDPQGLIKGTADSNGKITQQNQGEISGAAAMVATNESSVEVALEVDAKLVTDAETIEDTSYDFTEATQPAVQLKATYGGTGLKGSAPSPTIITGASVKTDIIMDKANYAFALTSGAAANSTTPEAYEYKLDPASKKEATITLSGNCSAKADWSDYVGANATKKVSLDITFKFYELGDDGNKDTSKGVTAAGGIIVNDTNKTITWDRTSDLTFTVDSSVDFKDFGVNYKGAIYAYTGHFNTNKTIQTANLATLSGNTITLKPAIATYLPVGATIYITNSSQKVGLSITVN